MSAGPGALRITSLDDPALTQTPRCSFGDRSTRMAECSPLGRSQIQSWRCHRVHLFGSRAKVRSSKSISGCRRYLGGRRLRGFLSSSTDHPSKKAAIKFHSDRYPRSQLSTCGPDNSSLIPLGSAPRHRPTAAWRKGISLHRNGICRGRPLPIPPQRPSRIPKLAKCSNRCSMFSFISTAKASFIQRIKPSNILHADQLKLCPATLSSPSAEIANHEQVPDHDAPETQAPALRSRRRGLSA